jgi:dynein heavy chain
MEGVVSKFEAGAAAIEALCRGVAEGLLVDVERKRVYDVPEFEEVQGAHHTQVSGRSPHCPGPLGSAAAWGSGKLSRRPAARRECRRSPTPPARVPAQATARLVDAHAGIHAALADMHAAFSGDGEDVQREWVRFTQRVDRRLEDALRATVKRSLQALSKLLNGDSKTEVLPLFRVTMVLERNSRVELRPTIQQLFDAVHKARATCAPAGRCRACGQPTAAPWLHGVAWRGGRPELAGAAV